MAFFRKPHWKRRASTRKDPHHHHSNKYFYKFTSWKSSKILEIVLANHVNKGSQVLSWLPLPRHVSQTHQLLNRKNWCYGKGLWTNLIQEMYKLHCISFRWVCLLASRSFLANVSTWLMFMIVYGNQCKDSVQYRHCTHQGKWMEPSSEYLEKIQSLSSQWARLILFLYRLWLWIGPLHLTTTSQ